MSGAQRDGAVGRKEWAFPNVSAGRSPGRSTKLWPISFATPTGASRPIVLTCYRLPKAVGSELAQGLEIVLEDQGEPPDPDRLRGRSRDEIKPGGLGLHYIRESMDVVEFSRSGGTNQLRLVRSLRPENTIQDS
jgi:hypothetical protein